MQSHNFNFEEEKALAAVLFVIDKMNGCISKHTLSKILYYADEKHLSHYGRSIFGEEYIAMEFGPVPSGVYDGIKCNPNLPLFKGQLEVSRYYVKSRIKPNLDFLSETDIECLQESISENGCLSFDALVEKSHSFAYNNAIRSHISIIDMAKEGGASDEMIEYIKENISDSQLY